MRMATIGWAGAHQIRRTSERRSLGRGMLNNRALFFYMCILAQLGCQSGSSTAVFEVPCGYSGRLVVEFDCPQGVPLEVDSLNRLVFRFDQSGMLFVSAALSEFAKTDTEIYRWSCDSGEHYRTLTANRIGSSWTGGRDDSFTVKRTDNSVEYTSGPTILTYFCTYVFANPDSAYEVIDSLKIAMKDCASYPEVVGQKDRCSPAIQ
jgi:hypothetical protein